MEAEILRIANEAKNEAHKASMNADKAHEKITSHEDICAIRYKGIIDSTEDVKDKLDSLMGRILYAGGTIILVLLSAVTSLAIMLWGK